jgi:MFS family permease
MVAVGQRRALLCCLPGALATWAFIALAKDVHLLLMLRLLQGVIVGLLMGPSVSYIVEVSHASIRGSMTGQCTQLNTLTLLATDILADFLHLKSMGY